MSTKPHSLRAEWTSMSVKPSTAKPGRVPNLGIELEDEMQAQVEQRQTSTERAVALVGLMARMDIDGECASCRKDGYDLNEECSAHKPVELSIDDSIETLGSLIASAREIVATN